MMTSSQPFAEFLAAGLAAGVLTLPTTYAICLVLGLGYTILNALLGGFGGAHDVGHIGDFGHDLDVGHDIDLAGDHGEVVLGHHGGLAGGAHMGPFSPLVIALFLTCFGGTGLLFTRVIHMGLLSLMPASGSSLAFSAATIWIFNRLFARVEATSQARACDLVGRRATVITPIPKGPGAGQIAYAIRGTRYTMTARSEDAVAIDRGAEAVILRVCGQSCFVAPPDDPRAAKAAQRLAHLREIESANKG